MKYINELLELDNLKDAGGCVSEGLSDLVEEAQKENGSDDLSDLLFEAMPSEYDLDRLLWILDVSAWCGHDNGEALCRSFERWLDSDDARKIYIVLHAGVYPYIDPREMNKKLQEVAARFPQFKNRCEELIKTRTVLEERGRRNLEAWRKNRNKW